MELHTKHKVESTIFPLDANCPNPLVVDALRTSSVSILQGPLLPPTLDTFSEHQVRKVFTDEGVEVTIVRYVCYDYVSETMTEVDSINDANSWAVKIENCNKYPRRSKNKAQRSERKDLLSSMSTRQPNLEHHKTWVLPFHFDLESAESIAKYCKYTGHDFFNAIADDDIFTYRRQIQYSTFEAEINSSNYYLLQDSIVLKLYSLMVSFMQIAILALVVLDSEDNTSVQRDNGQSVFIVAFLLPFISLYISATMITGLSDQAMSSAVKAYEFVPEKYQNIWSSILFSTVFYIVSVPFLLYWGTFKNKIAFCFMIEIILSTLAVAAVSAIVTSESDLINILFNFTGVLIVLDVDDRIAAWLKHSNSQAHLCYRNAVVKNGWSLKGETAEISRRRGMGATVGLFFYFFLAIQYIAATTQAPAPSSPPSSNSQQN